MTELAVPATRLRTPPAGASLARQLVRGRTLPTLTVLAAIIVIWFAGAVYLNAPRTIEAFERQEIAWTFGQLVEATWSMERPVLPTPAQVFADIWANTVERSVTSRRSLVFHAWVTFSSTAVGFLIGSALGVLIAVGMVHVRTLDRSLMPWVIASQAVPILAIAPMIVVVLGNIGLTGLVPKAIISAYLSFFPVTIGMVKGLRAPDPLQLDLMRTYSADRAQVFWKLRWPASVPFLFPSLKVGIALALVGAIVGELPTGAQAGLGARLLTGSYFGQTVQLWSALIMAALLALVCILLVTLAERLVLAARGTPP
ncbi:MAG: ABC transporter permease subunit [Alphaproteobacteria bacterium]|jgi:NitT/TauT family transport system permease protein|nr:ABC transporter permease subunit [Alphaproteobacteria bacterium]